MNKITSIDDYIQAASEESRDFLQQIRSAIREAAPEAEETINYGIPTFTLNGNLVHFGAFKNHIGFYPTPDGIIAFKEELSCYKSNKGSVQFPLNEPMPLSLIKKIVAYRVKENSNKKQSSKRK